MNKAGIYHHCGDTWCFALDENTLHIRIRTAAGDADLVDIVSGDPFEWGLADGKQIWKNSIQPMTRAGTNGVHDFWEIRIAPPFRRLKYWFIIHKGKKSWEFGEKGIVDTVDLHNTWNTFIFPFIHRQEVYHAPEWVGKTVWYQIFPERFHNGNPALNPPGTKDWQNGPVTNGEFYGGNLPGITAKLDHIAALGFNGIYLTPIFESPSVHKYDTADYLRIDPSFGTEDDLRTLVDGCHSRGIRIILDAVFNHSGTRFAPWQDVLEHGENSRFRDWFVIDGFPLFGTDPATGKPLPRSGDAHRANFKTFAFTTGMPKLNTANPETREYLLGVAEHYIRACGIDGWRLDVANEVDHEFWRQFRARVKAARSDAFIVGEIWHNSIDWLRGDQYDAIMNYHFGQALTGFLLGSPEIPDGHALADRMTTLEMAYPEPVIQAGFNLLDSHDTERLLNQLGGDLDAARQAWTLFALLPGSPCFYYGSEFALPGAGDPDCRRCMPWEDSAQVPGQYDFVKRLVALRRDNIELVNRGRRTWIWSARLPGIFGFRIDPAPETAPDGASRLTVLVNRSGKALPRRDYAGLLSAAERTDPAFTDIPAGGILTVTGRN